MGTKVGNHTGCKTHVCSNPEHITILQDEIGHECDVVVIFDAKMARKMIKAIRKSAKEIGWEV